MAEKKNAENHNKDSLSESGEMFENVFREAIAEEKRKAEERKLKKEVAKGVSEKPKERATEATQRRKRKVRKKPKGRIASRAALLLILLVVLAAAYTFYYKDGKLSSIIVPKQKSVAPKSRVAKPRKAPRRVASVKSSKGTQQKKSLPLHTPQAAKAPQSFKPKAVQAKKEPPKRAVVREPKVRLYPYSIYLGAFKTLPRAKRAVALYQEKGINPYWVKVNLGQKGTWYRIFEGHFPSREEAEAFIQKKQLKDAEVKATKYTNLVGVYSTKDEIKKLSLELLRLGYCPYAIPAQDGRVKLFTGAFYTQEGAENLLAELASKGIKATVVKR